MGGRPPGKSLFLRPGELVFVREPLQVSTVLGSCVAVTMFHARAGLAAICHAVLPSGGDPDGFKYVDVALPHMLEQFQRSQVAQGEIEVKLFGGADMFECIGDQPRRLSVGQQNIRTVTRLLDDYQLPLVASDVGGCRGRKLIFHSDTGVVLLKRLTGQDRPPGEKGKGFGQGKG